MKIVHLLLLCSLLFPALQSSTAGTATEKSDAKLMRLSLEVMLYNKDLENAFAIAQKGAARFEKELWWQQQAAQIALWLGKTDAAQKYYGILFARTQKPEYKQKLLTMLTYG